MPEVAETVTETAARLVKQFRSNPFKKGYDPRRYVASKNRVTLGQVNAFLERMERLLTAMEATMSKRRKTTHKPRLQLSEPVEVSHVSPTPIASPTATPTQT